MKKTQFNSMLHSPIIGLMDAASLPSVFSTPSFIFPLYMIKGNVGGNDSLYYCVEDVKRLIGEQRFRVLQCEVVTCLLPIKHVELVYNGNLN